MLLALGATAAVASPSIRHLRNINPYVAAAIADWGKQSKLAASLPRQLTALRQQSVHSTAGTSSFGMSGVNAHALISNQSLPARATSQQVKESQSPTE